MPSGGEGQHGDGVDLPVLLSPFVYSAEPVQPALDWPQQRTQPGAPATEDGGEVEAQRFGDEQHQQKEDDNLGNAVECERHTEMPASAS